MRDKYVKHPRGSPATRSAPLCRGQQQYIQGVNEEKSIPKKERQQPPWVPMQLRSMRARPCSESPEWECQHPKKLPSPVCAYMYTQKKGGRPTTNVDKATLCQRDDIVLVCTTRVDREKMLLSPAGCPRAPAAPNTTESVVTRVFKALLTCSRRTSWLLERLGGRQQRRRRYPNTIGCKVKSPETPLCGTRAPAARSSRWASAPAGRRPPGDAAASRRGAPARRCRPRTCWGPVGKGTAAAASPPNREPQHGSADPENPCRASLPDDNVAAFVPDQAESGHADCELRANPVWRGRCRGPENPENNRVCARI